MQPLSDRILTLLQFTRAALVFTAISNTLAAMLLSAGSWRNLDPLSVALALAMSTSLYAFGMALNDLVDRHKDQTLAASRPLPSGRISLAAAHLVVFALGTSSLIAGLALALHTDEWLSAVFLLTTLALINFYNLAGKYLVSLGLLTLGLIRGVHAWIAAPDIPVLWHGLLLMTHVVIVSCLAYVWEDKRPRFTRSHLSIVATGLLLVVILVPAWLLGREWSPQDGLAGIPAALHLTPGLALPALAAAAFLALAWLLTRRRPDPDEMLLRLRRREAGRRLMLLALLWLIVYDACFVLAFVGWLEAALLLLLLPLAYASVRALRWWSGISQPPPTS